MAHMVPADASAKRDTKDSETEVAQRVRARTDEVDEGQDHHDQRAAIVYNPLKVDLDVLRAAVTSAAEEAGWAETIWLETSAEDPGVGMTREAVDQGVDVVLAAGGDGTVRAVAEGLQGSESALALLPSGTGNLLARNLDLTLDNLTEAVSTAFAGKDRKVDLGRLKLHRPDGRIDEHAFVVMAGIGLDAQLMANTDDELKKKIGWLAYVQSIGQALKGGRRIRMTTGYDDHRPRRERLHTLLIGNCGSLPGNILLLPEAAVDDGVLDIVALRPDGLFGWLQISWKVLVENRLLHRTGAGQRLKGAAKEIRALNYRHAASIKVSLRRPEEIELDGDEFGEVSQFEAWVDKHGLRIKVPDPEHR